MEIKVLHDVAVSPNWAAQEKCACAFPIPCVLQNGDVLCLYRRGETKHSHDGVLIVQRSRDSGQSWEEPVTVYDGLDKSVPESSHAGAVGQAQDGTLVAMFTTVANAQADTYVFSTAGRELGQKFYVASSNDDGASWSAQEHVIPNAPRLTYINSRPVMLSDGDLLVPLEATIEEENSERTRQCILFARYSVKSKQFGPAIRVADDPTGKLSFGDPRLTRLADGRLLMLMWTFLNDTEETIAAHKCISKDDGVTWTTPVATDLLCQIPTPLEIDSTHMIAAGNLRVPPAGNRIWHSCDEGKTWNICAPIQLWDVEQGRIINEKVDNGIPDRKPQEEGTKIWNELPNFTFGTPDLVRLEDDTVLFTYYATLDDIIHVRACCMQPIFS